MTRDFPRIVVCALFVIGVASPAAAQVDLSGIWAPIFHEDQVERIPGPDVGDYAGLPITDAARMRADTWDASLLTLPEHQCKPHPSTYGFRGVGNLRITPATTTTTQSMIKLHTHIQWQEQEREIWMDGRPHPPDYAAHTWQGFSTGTWEGNVLVVKTTHLKAGWIRRNGLALTDQATMTERFIRHGNYLTHIYMIEDPDYLTEPLIKTNGFQLTPNPDDAAVSVHPTVEVPREKGDVPHHLPGENPFLGEFAKKHNLPQKRPRRRRDGAARVHEGPATQCQARSSRPGLASRLPCRGSRRRSKPEPAVADNEVHSLHVQGNVWMLHQRRRQRRGADRRRRRARRRHDDRRRWRDSSSPRSSKLAGDKPIRWIVNTHAHPDHTGGNAKVAAGGAVDHRRELRRPGRSGRRELRQDHRRTRTSRLGWSRCSRRCRCRPCPPTRSSPTSTRFIFNGEAVQFIHVPNAHTDGDVMVFFRKSDVLVAGDVFNTNTSR